jgi:DNA-binding MarR family transcriptional regulator
VNEIASPPAAPTATSAAARLVGSLHALEALIEARLGRAGLSFAKFGVLASLAEADGPISLGTLAERCSCVRSNITQLVDRLEADRLVERLPDPADRRSVRAALTAEGRARHAEGTRLLAEAEREAFADLGEADRAALLGLAGRLRTG